MKSQLIYFMSIRAPVGTPFLPSKALQQTATYGIRELMSGVLPAMLHCEKTTSGDANKFSRKFNRVVGR